MHTRTRRLLLDRKIIEKLRLGDTVKKIARDLKVGKPRIRALREKASLYGYIGTEPKPIPPWPELLFPEAVDKRSLRSSPANEQLHANIAWVKERLLAGWRPVTVFEELPSVGCLDITRSSFYRFMDRHDLYKIAVNRKKTNSGLGNPIVHTPGEALILDWGKLRTVWDEKTQKRKILWAFVGVMGFSRYMCVRLVWTNDVETTVDAISSMFQELGGVPAKVTSDNPKCFATTASRFEPILNPALEHFANHYNFVLECLPPADPQKKGKVERLMPYVRRLYEAHTDAWHGLEESQNYIDKKCAVANQRKHGTILQKPEEVFLNFEAAVLKTLPPLAYEKHQHATAKLRSDAFLRFDSKYYAVDDAFIGQELQIMASKTLVSIYAKGKLLETYPRNINPFEPHSTKDHLLKPHMKIIKDHGHYLVRARKIGPNVECLIQKLLLQNQGYLDLRKIWGILSLDKKYTPAAIDTACRAALEMGNISYRIVLNLLTLKSHSKTTPEHAQQSMKFTSKFARSIDDYKNKVSQLH